MRGLLRLALGMAALLFLAGATAPSELPAPGKREIDSFANGFSRYYSLASPRMVAWGDALEDILKKDPDLDAAARILAPQYGLSVPAMRELIELRIIEHALPSGGLPRDDKVKVTRQRRQLAQRFAALYAGSGYSELVLDVAAEALSRFSACPDEAYQAMVDAAQDHDGAGWRMAEVSGCSEWQLAFARQAPGKVMAPLIDRATGGYVDDAEAMTVLAWASSESGLSHVAAADRDAAAAWIARRYLDKLFDAGLGERARAFVLGLPRPVRDLTLTGELPARTVRIDGLAVYLSQSEPEEAAGPGYAATLALAGDADRARTALLFAGLTRRAQEVRDCLYALAPAGPARAPDSEPECPEPSRVTGPVLLLDQWLDAPGEDPYPIAETFYASDFQSQASRGVWADLACRVLSEAKYAGVCEWARQLTVEYDRMPQQREAKPERTLLAEANLPGYADSLRAFDAELAAAVARYGGRGVRDPKAGDAQAETPLPSRFEARPIPEAIRGPAPAFDPASLKGMAPLPRGFSPVRLERSGQRVVVVSLSQNYDPTGEISGGGYWVHLSEDGGKSWGRPLYTGLADLFPYKVKTGSRLPLLDGDVLNLAVDIRELDTASITYPPIALRTRRQQDDLYLRIPLADLARDSDGDGLTDIAADHLLLSGARPPGATPFVVGASRGADCKAGADPAQQAMAAFFGRRIRFSSAAIIEAPDRPAGQLAGLGSMRGVAVNSLDEPILLLGDPAEFACLRPNVLMIVYGKADLARLRRMTPDFHPLDLGAMVFNRAHDRAYMSYSSGWTGGTIRLIRGPDGRWRMEHLSSWIT